MSNTAYLSVGSNVGDRGAQLAAAVDQLRTLGAVTAMSSIYETEPVDFTAQPKFLNLVVALETNLDPVHLLVSTLKIERQLGRVRTSEASADFAKSDKPMPRSTTGG